MADDWCVQINGKIWGPGSAETLKQLVLKGKVTPDTLVRKGPSGCWVPAGHVQGLFPLASDQASPQTVPSTPRLEPALAVPLPVAVLQSVPERLARIAVAVVHRVNRLLLKMAGGEENRILYRFLQFVTLSIPVGVIVIAMVISRSNRQAEKARIDAANQEVRQAVEKAETWIQAGRLTDADQIERGLSVAAANDVATDKTSISPTLVAFGKTKAERQAAVLLESALKAIDKKLFDKAQAFLQQYLEHPNATELQNAKGLLSEIALATSDKDALRTLLAIDDKAFTAFSHGDASAIVNANRSNRPAVTPASAARWLNTSYDTTLYHVTAKEWAEIDNKNPEVVRWHLTETGCAEQYVQLFYNERNYTIRIYANRVDIEKNGKWEWVANGHWSAPSSAQGSALVVLSYPVLAETRVATLKKNLAEAGRQREERRKKAEADRLAEQRRIDAEKEVIERRERLAAKAKQEEKEAAQHLELMAAIAKQAEKDKKQQLASSCPLSIDGLRFDKDEIGTPKISLTVTNRKHQSIEAFEVVVACYDKFGDPADGFGFGENKKTLIYQEAINAGATIHTKGSWALYGHGAARRFKVTVIRVKTGDGTEWSPPEGFEDVNSGTYEVK